MKTLIIKEIQNHILSLRFLAGLLLTVTISLTAVVILTGTYNQEREAYEQRIEAQNNFLSQYAHSNRINPVIRPHRPPSPFTPLFGSAYQESAGESFDSNSLDTLFPALDFGGVVIIILTLLAMLMSYDSVSGEGEQGTLKLMLSNALSRNTLYVAKWLGGLAALTAPLLFSLLLSLTVVFLNPSLHWQPGQLGALALFFFAAVLFLSIFYLLGLWISTLLKSSSLSILSGLLLWVLFVLTIPNLSPYLAAQLVSLPPVNRVEKEIRTLTGIERDNLGRRLAREAAERFADGHGAFWTEFTNMGSEALSARISADGAFSELYQSYRSTQREAWQQANVIQGEKARKLRQDLESRAARQTWVAKHLACLSPMPCFTYIIKNITATGLRAQSHFQQESSAFYQSFNQYLQSKEASVRAANPQYNSNQFINLSDRPRFVYHGESLSGRILSALPYLALLVTYNLLFILLGFAAFRKRDIR